MEKTEQPPNFTPQARALWQELPANFRALLLENVFCAKCRGVTTITNYHGSVKQKTLVLEGQCNKCGSEVARLVD
jgi:hypothetical protein